MQHEPPPGNDKIGRRAAQYVRMSTDQQRYSTENQAVAIAAYALERNLTIVRTYIDQARSGLRFKNRIGLRGLIGDIVDHKADFVLSWFMTSAAGVASRISTRAPTTSLFARRPASLSSTVQNSLKTMIALHPPS